MTSKRRIYIYIHLPAALTAVAAARLDVEKLAAGSYVGSFRYGDQYLRNSGAVALDQFQLPLSARVYEFTKLNGLPGAVRDASPDAWGRRVIEHKLERAPADLDEFDYLLNGAQDAVGNLSFGLAVTPPGPMRSYNRTHQLADLIAAAEAVENGNPTPASLLERIETSLGGAKPKATIEDGNVLWLAKFPNRDDRFNLQRVEYATLNLARRAGLHACIPRLEKVGSLEVLMLPRFDRTYTGAGYARHGFVSGFTALDCDDGALARKKWSYPLLADMLRRWPTQQAHEQLELFRRMVFNAAVTNDDDHPRNHGLLHGGRGWSLAPAYDLVPAPKVSIDRRDLAMTVGKFGRTASIYNLVSECGRFGLDADSAKAEVAKIVDVVRGWRDSFRADGVSEKDIAYVQSAFLPECFFLEKPQERFDHCLDDDLIGGYFAPPAADAAESPKP